MENSNKNHMMGLLIKLNSDSKLKNETQLNIDKYKMNIFISTYIDLRQLERELAKLTDEYEVMFSSINVQKQILKKTLVKNCIHYANPNSISWSKIWDIHSYYHCPACDYHITSRCLTNIWDEKMIYKTI
jgi:hypothetical protein